MTQSKTNMGDLKLNFAYALLGISGTESILIFALCLPLIIKDIPMGPGLLSMTVASSTLAHAATVVPFGNLADRIGRRKIFMLGHVLGVFGGLIGVFAANPTTLISSRLIVGTGEGMLMGVGLAILSTLQPAPQLPIAISRWTVFITISNIFTLYIASTLSAIDWRLSMLYFPVLSFILYILAPALLKESKVKAKKDNLTANLLLGGSFALILFSLTRLEVSGFALAFWIPFVAGVCLALIWYRLQKHSTNPNFPIELLQDRTFLGGAIASFAFSFMYKSMNVQLPSFIETQQNIKGAMVGLIQTPSYVAGMISCIVIGYMLTTRLLTRRKTVALGFIVMSIGFLLLGQLTAKFDPSLIIVATIVLTIGVYFTALPSFDIITETAPKSFLGSVTGSHAVFAQLGGSFGLIISSSAIVLSGTKSPEGEMFNNLSEAITHAVNNMIIAVRQFTNVKLDLASNIDYLTAKSFHAYTTLFSLISLILLVIFLITYKPLSSVRH